MAGGDAHRQLKQNKTEGGDKDLSSTDRLRKIGSKEGAVKFGRGSFDEW